MLFQGVDEKRILDIMRNEYAVNPTCKTMEKIHYKYEESENMRSRWKGNGVIIGLFYNDEKFWEIVQTRYLNCMVLPLHKFRSVLGTI